MRILAGVGAWLLGAATATAGSLLAVSLLGQGIAASPGQQLTAAAVNQALAREADEASEATPPATVPTGAVVRHRSPRPPAAGATPLPRSRIEPSPASPSASRPSASPGAQVAAGTVLSSAGGTVLAECVSAGSYLVSWSPTQGYEADQVIRGPAVTTQVTFDSADNSVTMVVSCSAGVPTATSHVRGDDGAGNDE